MCSYTHKNEFLPQTCELRTIEKHTHTVLYPPIMLVFPTSEPSLPLLSASPSAVVFTLLAQQGSASSVSAGLKCSQKMCAARYSVGFADVSLQSRSIVSRRLALESASKTSAA